jgi:transposase
MPDVAILPDSSCLRLLRLTADATSITAQVVTKLLEARCPLCGHASTRIHSHYVRRVADLPWHGVAMRLDLHVRRFFCLTPECPRQIFVERLPSVVAPYARRTLRLNEVAWLIGFALGGEGGRRLASALGFSLSPDALLACVRATPAASPKHEQERAPRVLGVDDFAFRRGKRYGTLLVDLERHRVVALLADRTAGAFAIWLQAHQGVEIISRDRADAYAEGARAGAPTAVQVADRFHLVKNLGEALETFLVQKGPALKAAAQMVATAITRPLATETESTYIGKRRGSHAYQQRMEEASQQRHARRVALYEQIHALHARGNEVVTIARALGASRRTVYRYLCLAHPPERKRGEKRRPHVLAPYEDYLLRRWEEGCHNGLRLWREIRAQGYHHSTSPVARFVASLRRTGRPPSPSDRRLAAVTHPRGPSARQVAFLLLRRPDERTAEETSFLVALREQDTDLPQAETLTQAFLGMVRQRQGARLDSWLAAATQSGIPALRRFAQGMQEDHDAVQAGLTLPYNNGQLEGQVNRLKVIKRQMYGRANFDLLCQRVLHHLGT